MTTQSPVSPSANPTLGEPMKYAALVPLAWAAIVSVLVCWFVTTKREPSADVTKIEFVAARLFMFGGGAVALIVVLWQAAKILTS